MSARGRPVLWQYNFSNFNEKARWALDFKGIAHRRRSLLPSSPRAILFSARGTLPVLDLDGERIVDSTRIIEALERRQPEPALYPADPGARCQALGLEELFDEEVGHDVRRVGFWDMRDDRAFVSGFIGTGRPPLTRLALRAMMPLGWRLADRRYTFREEDAERSRGKIVAALDRIERELDGGDYLVGDAFSVADLTGAALLFPFAWPAELQYAYPYPQRWEFRDSIAERPAVRWVEEMYRRHRTRPASAEAS